MSDFKERLNTVRSTNKSNFKERLNTVRSTEKDKPPSKEAEAWYEDFGEGLVTSLMKTGAGIKDLIVGLDEEDKALVADWAADAAESGWGKGGEVVGDIAQIALPAGVLVKAAKVAGMAKAGSRTLPAIADIIASAGVAGIKAPTEDESRVKQL